MQPKRDGKDRAKRMLGALEELARRQDGTPEGERAAKAAFELRAKYDLEDFKAGVGPGEVIEKSITLPERGVWLRQLAGEASDFFDCACSYISGTKIVNIHGDSVGIELTQHLIIALYNQIQKALKCWKVDLGKEGVTCTRTGMNAFKRGAANALIFRLRDIKEAREEASKATPEGEHLNSLSLVRINAAAQSISGLETRKSKFGLASDAGIEAGQNIPIQEAIAS